MSWVQSHNGVVQRTFNLAADAPSAPSAPSTPTRDGGSTPNNRLLELYAKLKGRYEKVQGKSAVYKRDLAAALKAKATAEADGGGRAAAAAASSSRSGEESKAAGLSYASVAVGIVIGAVAAVAILKK